MGHRFNGVARLINDKANKASEGATFGLGLFLGEVTPKGIVTQRFKKEPITDYKVVDSLRLDDIWKEATTVDGQYPHSHKINTTKRLKKLNLGDIVIMALIEEEFYVLGRVSE